MPSPKSIGWFILPNLMSLKLVACCRCQYRFQKCILGFIKLGTLWCSLVLFVVAGQDFRNNQGTTCSYSTCTRTTVETERGEGKGVFWCTVTNTNNMWRNCRVQWAGREPCSWRFRPIPKEVRWISCSSPRTSKGKGKTPPQLTIKLVADSDLTFKSSKCIVSFSPLVWLWQSERLHKVLEFVSTVHDLCAVLGMDFFSTVTEVHPSLNDSTGVQSKSISNDTLSRLAKTVLALKEDKKQRLQKVTLSLFCSSCLRENFIRNFNL